MKNDWSSVMYVSITMMLTLFASCSTNQPMDLTSESIIPKPQVIAPTGNSFELTEQTTIYYHGGSDEMKQTAVFLAEILRPATAFKLDVRLAEDKEQSGNIYLNLTDLDEGQGSEGYEIIITKETITLNANHPEGLFRGIQTLRQLLPAGIEMKKKQAGPWLIATGEIRDYPEYAYRGVMLDVSRHFFLPEQLKQYIDLLALYKINILHLHLSDDQGWRIEIKSWPRLTEIGGKTEVDGGKGGFYTQEEYSDIVNYAGERYITIVPEIDMPGHTNAALASYAKLNCDGKARELYTGTEVGFSTLCTRDDSTYKFVDDVIRELAAITPGPYIHIGGDESHVTKKPDYIYFINRVQQIVEKYGKQMIGWEEIAQAELLSNSIAQHWRNSEYPVLAVNQGVKILMSPANKIYLDMKYDSTTQPGLSWAGFIEVDSAYLWDPASLVKGIGREDIIGIEAPLWTETITNMEELEYMVFPRIAGYAEIGWVPAENRDWNEYRLRLGRHGKRMDAMGINFYRSDLVPWIE